MRVSLFLGAAALLLLSHAAHADSFAFSFGSSTSLLSGSGTLTTGDLEAPGEYVISTVSGSVRTAPNTPGIAIQSILPVGSYPTVANGNNFPANDNTLFVFNNVGTLSQDGLSFLLTNRGQVNLFNSGAGDGELSTPAGATNGAENVTEYVPIAITAVAPTPEPSSFALLGTGMLGFAFALNRRAASRTKSTA